MFFLLNIAMCLCYNIFNKGITLINLMRQNMNNTTGFVNVADIVEKNGKTVRENNSERKHIIPIGSLVEILPDEDEEAGLRLYVVGHSRDCDQTPLYNLSFRKDAQVEMERYNSELQSLPAGQDRSIAQFFYLKASGSIYFNLSEESLKVIK
mgnify:CR=1 FL=1